MSLMSKEDYYANHPHCFILKSEYLRAEKANLFQLHGTHFSVCKCATSVYLFCCRYNQQEFSDEICS